MPGGRVQQTICRPPKRRGACTNSCATSCKKMPTSCKKTPSSCKKMPTSCKETQTSCKRTPSSCKKTPSSCKETPSSSKEIRLCVLGTTKTPRHKETPQSNG